MNILQVSSWTMFVGMMLVMSGCNVCWALSSGEKPNIMRGSESDTTTTIAVCTGPDCRVDGSSECLRQFQTQVSSLSMAEVDDDSSSSNTLPNMKRRRPIRVTGRPCIGPCGDGPCVFVLDGEGQKVIQSQKSKISVALVPPDIFGSDPKGWYQVRTLEQVSEVMDIAIESAGIVTPSGETQQQSITSAKKPFNNIIASNRPFYDRPRNERKVMQRLMQVLVLVGLGRYNDDMGQIGTLQLGLALVLFGLSECIMKENIFTLLTSFNKKIKKKSLS